MECTLEVEANKGTFKDSRKNVDYRELYFFSKKFSNNPFDVVKPKLPSHHFVKWMEYFKEEKFTYLFEIYFSYLVLRGQKPFVFCFKNDHSNS